MTHGPPRAGRSSFSPIRGLPVGRVAGVRILVAPSWVASVAVIAVLGLPVVRRVVPGTGTVLAVLVAVLLGVLLGVSVLAHELGHCVVARWRGIDVVAVRLYLLGGVSELARGPVTARDEALVAAAGPAVSGLLAGAFWLALQATDPGTLSWLILLLLALSNLVIAVFNLLPAVPLDGGRVIRAGIWGLFGSRRAGTLAAVVGGYLLAAALLGWAVYLLVRDGLSSVLPAGIAVGMALFVAMGVWGEHHDDDDDDDDDDEETEGSADARNADERPGPTGLAGASLSAVARPSVRLAADVPVGLALDAAGHGAVLLVRADGVAGGVLDPHAARELAHRDPTAPASLAARPITPEGVVFAGDDPADVLARAAAVDTFVLVDDTGQPVGVIRAADLLAAARRPNRTPPSGPGSGRAPGGSTG